MNQPTTEKLAVVVERELPHPPEKVWRALTQPHLIAEWLMQNDFKPDAGHRFTLRIDPQPNWNGVIDCQVLVVEPNTTLSYTWSTLGLETVVTFTLTATSGGTRLRFEQTGFPPDRPQNYQGAKYGWQNFMTKLEQLLARVE